MKTSTVVRFKAKSFSGILKESYSVLIMFFVYIGGMVFGVFSLEKNSAVLTKAESLYRLFMSERTDKTFMSQFGSAIMEWLPFMLAVFACGTCIVGMVLAPIFVCYKGFCYGILAGYLYSLYSFKGIIFVLILIIPCTLMGAFSMFFAGGRSYQFSLRLAKSVMPQGKGDNMYEHLTHYLKDSLFLIVISLFASITDAMLSTAFFDKIKLL